MFLLHTIKKKKQSQSKRFKHNTHLILHKILSGGQDKLKDRKTVRM